ncbi:SusD-like starch-binding protein associating with outer membrane [Pedobacter nutrimenti]|uniref:SusD-like starch-binding protein associating with outer membrane n=2 Tax=Pedobacter nutrimenti TaxID=1241337 RepID=A0A318UHS6_9SPHI|nr:SusD-like starch-binding protein associating with outer membrane [Pedobacter nutrimenti]
MLFALQGCKKAEFLDKKPNTKLVVPETLADMKAILDNLDVMNGCSPGLPVLSADEYFYPALSDWNSASTATERNAYIWAKDIYVGTQIIGDWNKPYGAIFYANVVLDQWNKLPTDQKNSPTGQFVKGFALFHRAYNSYELLQTFSVAYDPATAGSDLGIPLRLSSDINDRQPRASVQQSYQQVILDLENAEALLAGTPFPEKNRNRPCSASLNALEARVYLSMRNYPKAQDAAKKSLALYNKLVDYNSLDQNSDFPFGFDYLNIFLEVLCLKSSSIYNNTVMGFNAGLPTEQSLIDLYESNDLRRTIFFSVYQGNFYLKAGYVFNGFFFTGLAVDEVYLINAECLARKGDLDNALKFLNQLLEKRYVTGKYVAFQSTSKQEVIDKILLERRKELVWRGLRWSDIKRLNKEGSNITLTRNLGGQTYTLPPNDPRYALPIPDDEIALSGIQQNPR